MQLSSNEVENRNHCTQLTVKLPPLTLSSGSVPGHRQGEEKVQNVHNFAKYVAPGGLLMLRSAHGAHAFSLYCY